MIEPRVDSNLSLSCNVTDFKNHIDNEPISWTYYVNSYWKNNCDPRVRHLPLLDTPWSTLSIIFGYLIFVTYLGPKFMNNKEPFSMRKPMLIYNISMVMINSYFLMESIVCLQYGLRLLNVHFPSRNDYSPFSMRMINSAFLYFCTKFIDLMDTVFFVMRKKYSQITPLHVYHHATVPMLGWLAMKIGPTTPAIYLFAAINSLVHVIMYSYYALSALGPEVQKYLWWKRYITQLQLMQFIILGIYGALLAAFQTGYDPIFFCLGFVQPPIFFWMFYDFYCQSYRNSKKLN